MRKVSKDKPFKDPEGTGTKKKYGRPTMHPRNDKGRGRRRRSRNRKRAFLISKTRLKKAKAYLREALHVGKETKESVGAKKKRSSN